MKKTTYPKDKWLSCIQNSLLLQPITRGTGVCRPIKQAGLLTYRSSHLAAFPVSQWPICFRLSARISALHSLNTVTSSHRIHTCFSFHRIHLPKRFLRHLFPYPIFFLYHKASQAKNQPFFAWLPYLLLFTRCANSPYFLTADVLLILLRSVQTGKPVQYQIPFCSRSCLPYSCGMQLLRMPRSLLP